MFKNNSGVDYSNFYSGIFFDWDIDETTYDGNITKYDLQNNFGYVQHASVEQPFIGMAQLTNASNNFYGIANDCLDGGIGIYDGYTDASKWLTLTNGLNKTNAGPNDISCVISAGPFNIKADSTLIVAFSINAASNLEALQSSVINSRIKYNSLITDILENNNQLPTVFSLEQNYPNPFNPSTTIKYSIPSIKTSLLGGVGGGFVTLKIYDILGCELATLVNEYQKSGNYEVNFDATQLTSGVYFYRLQSGSFVDSKKMILIK